MKDLLWHRATALLAELEAETDIGPSQRYVYGRPHEHGRVHTERRYAPTGQRLPGVNVVRPDCPTPVRGVCQCAPDGSWRPSPGVQRNDATAHHAVGVRLSDGVIWVDNLYFQLPDGRWQCRWPVRRALERLRGESEQAYRDVLQLLKHPNGDYTGLSREHMLALTARVARWANEERIVLWERRPQQWWRRKRRARVDGVVVTRSDAQLNAEAVSRFGLYPAEGGALT